MIVGTDWRDGAQIIEQGRRLLLFPLSNRIVLKQNYNRDNNEFV